MAEPTVQSMRSQAKKVESMGRQFKDPKHGGPRYNADMAVSANHPSYPDYMFPETKDKDRYMATKRDLALAGQTGGLGKVSAGREDIDYIMSKQDMEESAKFKAFVEESIPRGTPWAKEYFEKIQPGWYKTKEQVINEKVEMLKRYFHISLMGPQSIEDMYLLYILATGKIALPTKVEEIMRPTTPVQGLTRNNYAIGPFSVTHYVTDATRLSARNQEFMANIGILGVDPKGLTAVDAGYGDKGGGANSFTTPVTYGLLGTARTVAKLE